jgi:hypothetical protein
MALATPVPRLRKIIHLADDLASFGMTKSLDAAFGPACNRAFKTY